MDMIRRFGGLLWSINTGGDYMRFPDSSGLFLSIVDGFIKEEEMMVKSIDNYHYPFRDFVEEAQTSDLTSLSLRIVFKLPGCILLLVIKIKFSV